MEAVVMPYKKTIVCFANSRKMEPNRCVAGKELRRDSFGSWIRPVSDRPKGELILRHRRYEDGADPKLLDVMTISFLQARPQGCQQENHLIDSDTRWVLKRRITWDELAPAVDRVTGPLWVNEYSGRNGMNDRIPEDIATELSGSLLLIEPEQLKIRVAMEGGYDKPAQKKVRARFRLNGYEYLLALTDPSVAPPGKHIMSCFVQYAPYKLRPGLNWDDQKEAFGDNVINTIAEYAPNIKDIILHRQIVTPLDLEREFGLSEGNIFQGELSLEQLFFLRPVPGWAQFRTPIKNLYMCGSATHPGGGIMGGPGRLAALEILKDFKGAA